jgi:hypothetical protein
VVHCRQRQLIDSNQVGDSHLSPVCLLTVEITRHNRHFYRHFYAVVTDLATALEIITRTPPMASTAPQVKIFDKTITNLGLVRDTQQQLDALPRNVLGFCIIAQPAYGYMLRFATHGRTTQKYAGNIDCPSWTIMTLGTSISVESAGSARLYGYNLMSTLHQLTRMSLPSWWLGENPLG